MKRVVTTTDDRDTEDVNVFNDTTTWYPNG